MSNGTKTEPVSQEYAEKVLELLEAATTLREAAPDVPALREQLTAAGTFLTGALQTIASNAPGNFAAAREKLTTAEPDQADPR